MSMLDTGQAACECDGVSYLTLSQPSLTRLIQCQRWVCKFGLEFGLRYYIQVSRKKGYLTAVRVCCVCFFEQNLLEYILPLS